MIKRVEEVAGGGLVGSIERIAMPRAETLLASAQAARAFSDGTHDALRANAPDRNVKISRTRGSAVKARRKGA